MSDSTETNLLNIFRDEVAEYLETMNTLLMQTETATTMGANSVDTEALRELNRVAHSMKGASRAVGLKVIETIAHYMEEVFDAALNQGLKLTPEVCDLVYDGLDLIQHVVEGREPKDEPLAMVLAGLEQVVIRSALADVEVEDEAPESVKRSPEEMDSELREVMRQIGEFQVPSGLGMGKDTGTVVLRSAEESIRVPVGKLDRLMAEVSELLVARMQAEERMRQLHALRQLHGKWRREWQGIRAAYIRLARRLQEKEAGTGGDMAIIFDFLENNQRYLAAVSQNLAQLVQALGQDNLRLATLADQFQDDVGGMRMLAFETLMGGFQRIVRDLARDTGKEVLLDIEGAMIEVDKTVLDTLKDPIMHLLRNAIDHGIELPDLRERRGKSRSGRVTLDIDQRGHEIIVCVSDDGAGIDIELLRRKAISGGLFTAQELDLLSEDDLRSLVFYPGVTTSDEVTPISGRGIGMDVVQDRVESLRGTVSIQSELGKGTTISLSVPVSLTRIRCVLLDVGEETYAISSAVITRMMTRQRDEIFTAENHEMILIDDQPVPLVAMAEILGVPAVINPESELKIMVLRAADRSVAFEVDNLESERELVLKSLGPEIARAPYVSGAALLGTGGVIVVLDANDLIRSATGRTRSSRPLLRIKRQTASMQRQKYVLVVDDSITTRTLEKNILETAGFNVSVAIDGQEAWQKIGEQPFDVIICDVEMPKMNGLELTRLIKETERTRHLPVILLTSLAKPEQREAGLEAGADAYLVKSGFDQAELLQMIRQVI